MRLLVVHNLIKSRVPVHPGRLKVLKTAVLFRLFFRPCRCLLIKIPFELRAEQRRGSKILRHVCSLPLFDLVVDHLVKVLFFVSIVKPCAYVGLRVLRLVCERCPRFFVQVINDRFERYIVVRLISVRKYRYIIFILFTFIFYIFIFYIFIFYL